MWVSANLLACAALAQAPAIRLTTFYETWPGDNVAPPVRTVVAIRYDAHALYVSIWAQDPDPARVRAAYADRDNVGPGDDYVELVLDTRGDARVGTRDGSRPGREVVTSSLATKPGPVTLALLAHVHTAACPTPAPR